MIAIADVTSIMGGWIGDFVGGMGSLIFFLVIAAVAVFALYAVFVLGIFEKRPYTVHLRRPRANGKLKEEIYQGRFLIGKNAGEFEIKFGLLNYMRVAAPPESLIEEGNVYGVNPTRNEVQWTQPPKVVDEDGNQVLRHNTLLTEGQQLSWGKAFDIAYKRTHKPSLLEKHGAMIAIILGLAFVGICTWYGDHEKAQGDQALASAMTTATQANADFLRNATFVVYKPDQTITTPNGMIANPNQVSNAPPG